MITFIGDYTCKVDAKSRILLPSAFKRQMPKDIQDKFVIKKDIFENCLLLIPIDEWERQNKILRSKTNPFNHEHNKFLRGFFKGIAEVLLDGNNRLLIPKRLLDEIEAEKELVLAGQFGKIEIWPKDIYQQIESGSPVFAALAEKIMGNINNETDE